jgi:hypothetical protein
VIQILVRTVDFAIWTSEDTSVRAIEDSQDTTAQEVKML